jgi:hypothetical protein
MMRSAASGANVPGTKVGRPSGALINEADDLERNEKQLGHPAVPGASSTTPGKPESAVNPAPAPPATGFATTRWAKLTSWITDPARGWDTRLWCWWALYTALAYTIILATIGVLAALGLDLIHVVTANHRLVGTLLIATFGAALYGGVLGTLQWRVLRERVAIPRRKWIAAAVVPALAAWIVVVVPTAIHASGSKHDLDVAYLLAVSQALALGPLVGFSQATALKPYTDRWAWWIGANVVSYLAGYVLFFLISQIFGSVNFAKGQGTPLDAYIVLLLTAPLSARWMLWITAPGATRSTTAAA